MSHAVDGQPKVVPRLFRHMPAAQEALSICLLPLDHQVSGRVKSAAGVKESSRYHLGMRGARGES